MNSTAELWRQMMEVRFPFTLAGSFKGAATLVGKFDPTAVAVLQKSDFTVTVADTKGPLAVGTVTAIGTSTAPTKISIDEAGYKTELQNVILSLKDVWFPSQGCSTLIRFPCMPRCDRG